MADAKERTQGSAADVVVSLAEGVGTRTALAAGKEMAKRALEDLTLTSAQKQEREGARKRSRTKTLLKVIGVAVVGVVAALSLMSLLANLWMYALGLLVVGVLAGGGYLYVKPKVMALKARAAARLNARTSASDAAARARLVQEAALAKDKKLEDELAALKKKAQ